MTAINVNWLMLNRYADLQIVSMCNFVGLHVDMVD